MAMLRRRLNAAKKEALTRQCSDPGISQQALDSAPECARNRDPQSVNLPATSHKAKSESQPIPSTDGTKHNHGHGQAHVEEYVEPVGFVMHAATVRAPNTVMSFFSASWTLRF